MTLARESAQVVEDSGDLVLLALFLAQLSLAELYAEGVTPGVLERALELEQLVGPLPTHDHADVRRGTALDVRGRARALRARLSRARTPIAAARGDDLAQAECPALSRRARVPRRGVEPRRRTRRGDAPGRGAEGLRASGRIGALDPWPGRCLPWPPRPSSRSGDRGSLALARAGRAGVPRAAPCPARPDRPVHRRLPRQRRRSWLRSSAGSSHAVRAGAEPVPGAGAFDRGAGRGRRPRRGPRPARMAGGSRPPARHSLAARDGCALPGPAAGGRGRPRSGARKLRAGAGGARADACAVRARPHPAHLRHDPSPHQAQKGREGGDRGGAFDLRGAAGAGLGRQRARRACRGSAAGRPRAVG